MSRRAVVGRVDSDLHRQAPRHRLHAERREDRRHAATKPATLAADQRARPHPAPVVVDGRRIRQLDGHYPAFFHGGVLLVVVGTARRRGLLLLRVALDLVGNLVGVLPLLAADVDLQLQAV